MTYTIKELIEKLESFPKNFNVELDCDGGIYEEMMIDRVGKDRVVIFSQGESKW